jgi:hypothetical protein
VIEIDAILSAARTWMPAKTDRTAKADVIKVLYFMNFFPG